MEVLEEITANTENLDAVDITVSVGVLATTNNDLVANATVSFHMHMNIGYVSLSSAKCLENANVFLGHYPHYN